MNDNSVSDYGWNTPKGPQSCDYITPQIISILKRLGTKRILDIGSVNGRLCSELSDIGYEVAGPEYDAQGVSIARSNYPRINFYKVGVQDNPAHLLTHEKHFDTVVSTEVIEHLFSPDFLPNICQCRAERPRLPGGGHTL